MKTVLLFLLFFQSNTFSQTTENLKIQTQKYHDAQHTMDFDILVDMTYPKIVQTIIREVMTEKLDSDYQNDEFRKRIQIVKPDFKYSVPKKIDGTTVCIITYYNPIRYFFEIKLDAASAAKKVSALKISNNASEVIYEPKRNSINVKRVSKIIAISDETTQNQWKFIDPYDSSQMAIFETLVSAESKTALGL